MRFFQPLTILLVVSLPLFPLQLDTKIIFAIAGFSLILSPIFIKNFSKDIQKKNLATIFFLLFLLASTLSTIFSIDHERSLFYLLLYFSCFVVFTSIRSLFPNLRSKLLLTTFYLLLITILSSISLYNTLILNYTNRDPEGLSFMWVYYGHNHLSALLIFAIPLAIALIKIRPFETLPSIAYCLLPIALLFSLFFTFGLTSMTALALASIIIFLLFGEARLSKKLFVGLIITFSLLIFFSGSLLLNANFGINKKPEGSFKARLVYWENAIKNFQKHPIFGSGLNTFKYANQDATRKTKLGADFAHNFFIQILSDAGILGFLSSIGLVFAVLWQSFKKIQNTKYHILYACIFAALLASTLNTLFDVDWQVPYVFLIFWLLAGLV